jgi:serine/threonine protein kinase
MGIFHRDIKRENIVVDFKKDQRKTIQLIDWGFATKEASSTRTCGSRGYMAPELYFNGFPQGKTPKTPNHVEPLKTDLYAVGVTLYEIITGKSFSDSLGRIGPPIPDETFDAYFGRKKEAIDAFLDTQEKKGALSKEYSRVIKGFLRTNPAERLSIDKALEILSPSPKDRMCIEHLGVSPPPCEVLIEINKPQ